MTEEPKDTAASKTEGAASPTEEQSAVSSTGRGVTSPYDSPTGVLPRMSSDAAPSGPDLAKDVPRTEEELGLDPEIPSVGEQTRANEAAAYSYASIPPAPNTSGAEPSRPIRRRNGDARRGTLDLGLFVLRLVVGGTFIYHGLQKLTGWFHGAGLDGTRDMMASGGWDHATLSTILVIAGEVGGGGLLVLGLATPLAAGAVLAVIIDAWLWKQGMIPGFQYKSSVKSGVELESILVGTAVVLLLTGPGRLSFDRNRGWATRPAYGSFVVLILAVAAAIGTWYWLHGGNPLTGIGPFE
ncbi:DoxX family protein [Nocardia vinacea]|uniref:DoxX family protein n=1 Tax=Nocardia vinacea TaxID=96468 RepID=UPI000594404F|nr:DoxX family protein [Nocardia vinacea]